jgi:hypothetical protein
MAELYTLEDLRQMRQQRLADEGGSRAERPDEGPGEPENDWPHEAA